MFLLVLLRTAHVLLRLLLQLILSVKLLMLPSANAVSHISGNMVYRFCLGASNKKIKKIKKLIWNKVDCWCSETRLKHTKDWKELWILIRQKCAHVFLFVCCLLFCCCFLVNSEFWSDNTKRVHIFKVKPFSSRPVNKWIAFCSVHYLCVICLSVAWGLPTEFAHLLYCLIKIVILFQPFCVGVFQ